MTQETLFKNGIINSMDSAVPNPEAVAIADGKIVAVGSALDVEDQIGAKHHVIDLHGSVLQPGFVEPHSHILWAAKTRGAPVGDITAAVVPTYRAAIAKVKRHVAEAVPGEFLLFYGVDPQLHTDMEEPSRSFLDEIAPNNPLALQTSNGHAVFMNSAALDACNITKDTPTPVGSVIARDDSGTPTGRLEEALVWRVLEIFYESWGENRLTTEFRKSIDTCLRAGVTTVTEHLYLPFYKTYYLQALKQAVPLPRVAAYQQAVDPDMMVERIDLDDRLWMAGVKIHADGSPFVGNIWLTKPYLETSTTLERMHLSPGHTGGPNYPADFFEMMVRNYFGQGWQMSVHTQGDRTIDMVLDLVETILEETPRDDHRFRLEHCALMREDQIVRAKDLGVQCSFFINHITHWGGPIEDALFGPERAAHYMPAGSAHKAGMRLSLHADAPMTVTSGLDLMQAASTRMTNDGRCLGENERLDRLTALKAVTIDAAFHIGMEHKLGSLTRGKLADLVILDRDPLDTNPHELSAIQVEQTWLAGECVYRR
ncbi:amidohydrolase [Pelagibius litoralis]|uniref:Amidohydrolase n=1 Tax=Pelagibius litoralis TaxID=374515 RepID=A0A967EZQ9_9PROT|nr:amidohydrolase [Pelagibius litoralis]NIA70386.1 amidohydrolase [Pelagibius litoralis]